MKRRNFLKTSSVIAAASLLPGKLLLADSQKSIGLQLYTIRKDINQDLEGSLKRVAEIGYKTVELASYDKGKFYGKTPAEFKSMLADLGLHALSTHNGVSPDNIQQIAEDAATLGVEYLTLPYLGNNQRKTLEDYKNLCDQFNQYGGVCRQAGLKFAYHNHAFEFEMMDDQVPYDILVENTDPGLVSFELDLYWIKKAGFEPVDYFKKYPGRFSLWHVKDMDPATGKFTEVGSGNIDFRSIFENRKTSGLEHFFVELDFTEGSALESIKISFDYLNKAEFVI
jgi:sugar phosphate isomerase/epimerase